MARIRIRVEPETGIDRRWVGWMPVRRESMPTPEVTTATAKSPTGMDFRSKGSKNVSSSPSSMPPSPVIVVFQAADLESFLR